MFIELDDEQQRALDTFFEWWNHREDDDLVFRLFGYAGTGKTTLAQHIRANMPNPARVRFCAFTGKAAHVLRCKGCFGATTIHRLIYQRCSSNGDQRLPEEFVPVDDLPLPKPQKHRKGGLEFIPNGTGVRKTELIIVDECSMIDDEIGRDLLGLGIPLLVLGDPAQLPPVKRSDGGFFNRAEPDVLLRQIHRQAENSPVLQLATAARLEQRVRAGYYRDPTGKLPESRIVDGPGLTREMILGADQVIVGTNLSCRLPMNELIRRYKGFDDPLPMVGDKLVCLKNSAHRNPPTLNGSLWTVIAVRKGEGQESKRGLVHLLLRAIDRDAEGNFPEAEAVVPVEMFLDPKPPHQEHYDMFTYGYALTAHKSQGSEWPHVLIIDQSYCFRAWRDGDRDNSWKWLYTAITRAQERVTVSRWWKMDYAP
jgi:ATP-dependent exoDNAse (exonuclease V) alpha subunit